MTLFGFFFLLICNKSKKEIQKKEKNLSRVALEKPALEQKTKVKINKSLDLRLRSLMLRIATKTAEKLTLFCQVSVRRSGDEHVQGPLKNRSPIFQKSCLSDRDSPVRGNEGAAGGPTDDNGAGGRDPDPEDIKAHRVPSTHAQTHAHGWSWMKSLCSRSASTLGAPPTGAKTK